MVPDGAGRQMHRPPHGAGLYLRKEDEGAQGRCVHLHGVPLLPDPGPFYRRRDRQRCQRRELRARQAQILWPVQSGRGHHQSAGRGPVLRRKYGQVLADLRGAAGAVPPGAAVPPRASAGHHVGRRPHPVAIRRAGPAEKGRNHRQAAV